MIAYTYSNVLTRCTTKIRSIEIHKIPFKLIVIHPERYISNRGGIYIYINRVVKWMELWTRGHGLWLWFSSVEEEVSP